MCSSESPMRTYSTKSVVFARRASPVRWSSTRSPLDPGTKCTRSPPRSAWGLPSRSCRTNELGADAIAASTTSRGNRILPSAAVGSPWSRSRCRSFGPRTSMPTSARRRLASATMEMTSSGSRTWTRGRTGGASGQRDAFPPVRDVDGESSADDLRGDGELRIRVAMDEEDRLRVARRPRLAAGGEVAEPLEELALVRMRGEAADRLDLAADLPDLAVQL